MHIHVAKALVKTYPKTRVPLEKAIAAVVAGAEEAKARRANYLQSLLG